MARCIGFKASGEPCERIVRASQTYFFSHDPSKSEARRKAASKAGKSKPGGEISTIKSKLKELANDVLAGNVTRADGSVVAQIYGVLVRTIEVERKVRETEELAQRLEQLEQASQGGSRWGA